MVKLYIIYDIPQEDSETRRKLREYIKNQGGKWQQQSVYKLDIPANKIKTITSQITEIIKETNSRVDIIFPCKKCRQKIKLIGPATKLLIKQHKEKTII